MRRWFRVVVATLALSGAAQANPINNVDVYDEWASPPAGNGPGAAAARVGSPGASICRLARLNGITPPANVYCGYDWTYNTGRSDTREQGNKWPMMESGEACRDGGTWPNCTVTKNHTGIHARYYVKSGESEDSAEQSFLYYSGPGDAIGRLSQLWAWGSSPAAGDEGATIDRYWIFDRLQNVIGGTLGATLSSTTMTSSITPANYWPTLVQLGSGGLIVFDDATLSDRSAVTDVTGVDWGNRTWTISNAAEIPSTVRLDSGLNWTGYCFYLNAAGRSVGGSTYEHWLPIDRGPGDTGPGGVLASNQFTTWQPKTGGQDMAPTEWVPGDQYTSWASGASNSGKIAPCEQLKYVDHGINQDSGQPVTASSYTMYLRGLRTGRSIASGKTWKYSLFGFPARMMGGNIVLEKTLANSQASYGWNITNAGAQPTDDQTYFEAMMNVSIRPGTNPTRAGAFYGYQVLGPARDGAFRQFTHAYGPGWSETAPLVRMSIDPTEWNNSASDNLQLWMADAWPKRAIGYVDADTRALRTGWYGESGQGIPDETRQIVETKNYPAAFYSATGTCSSVCADVSLTCTGWKIISSGGTLSDGGACTNTIPTYGGYCHCKKP